MEDYYSQFYPKPRTGKECKKTDCVRHAAYLKWGYGNNQLTFCMACKNAHDSQFQSKIIKGKSNAK